VESVYQFGEVGPVSGAEGTSVQIKVSRTGAAGDGAAIVQASHGTTSAGDFDLGDGNPEGKATGYWVNFKGSETEATLSIPLTKDTLKEPVEEFVVDIIGGSHAEHDSVGSRSSITVQIRDPGSSGLGSGVKPGGVLGHPFGGAGHGTGGGKPGGGFGKPGSGTGGGGGKGGFGGGLPGAIGGKPGLGGGVGGNGVGGGHGGTGGVGGSGGSGGKGGVGGGLPGVIGGKPGSGAGAGGHGGAGGKGGNAGSGGKGGAGFGKPGMGTSGNGGAGFLAGQPVKKPGAGIHAGIPAPVKPNDSLTGQPPLTPAGPTGSAFPPPASAAGAASGSGTGFQPPAPQVALQSQFQRSPGKSLPQLGVMEAETSGSCGCAAVPGVTPADQHALLRPVTTGLG